MVKSKKVRNAEESRWIIMYLKRKIDQYLQEWKAGENRKPLIVKGARQIGKTESIREFAKANYSSSIEINFVEEPKYKTIIGGRICGSRYY